MGNYMSNFYKRPLNIKIFERNIKQNTLEFKIIYFGDYNEILILCLLTVGLHTHFFQVIPQTVMVLYELPGSFGDYCPLNENMQEFVLFNSSP